MPLDARLKRIERRARRAGVCPLPCCRGLCVPGRE
jgi:hypothetical protein